MLVGWYSQTMKAQLEEDLGKPLSEIFELVEEQPIAAASLAQVHRGVTRDGQEVAIKVRSLPLAILWSATRKSVAGGISFCAPHPWWNVIVAALGLATLMLLNSFLLYCVTPAWSMWS